MEQPLLNHLWAADRPLIGAQAAGEQSPISGLSVSHQRAVKAVGGRLVGGWRAVEGRLTYRTYEDGEGQTRYITEVVANEMLMLEKRPAHV